MKSRSAEAILDASYLETRAKLLEVAAILDRIDRAAANGSEMSESAATRHDQLIGGIRLLLSDSPRRAQDVQQLFSRAYDPEWRSDFGLPSEHDAEAGQAQTPRTQTPPTKRD